ncbi:MAG: hypothetical protein NZL96_03955 [Patescibacteria group bacterium]|nr:hypothetical protein [Patescibacteria group bacterium]
MKKFNISFLSIPCVIENLSSEITKCLVAENLVRGERVGSIGKVGCIVRGDPQYKIG